MRNEQAQVLEQEMSKLRSCSKPEHALAYLCASCVAGIGFDIQSMLPNSLLNDFLQALLFLQQPTWQGHCCKMHTVC